MFAVPQAGLGLRLRVGLLRTTRLRVKGAPVGEVPVMTRTSPEPVMEAALYPLVVLTVKVAPARLAEPLKVDRFHPAWFQPP